MEFRWHIGQFLVFVSLIVLAVFFITDLQQSPNFMYFCSGLLVLVAGGYFMWLGRNPPQDSGRFRLLRSKREKQEKNKQK